MEVGIKSKSNKKKSPPLNKLISLLMMTKNLLN